MQEKWIPNSEAGVRATLEEMKQLARAGGFYMLLDQLTLRPPDIDRYLAEHWDYVYMPLNGQVLRSVPWMLSDLKKKQKITGACADAAIFAGAILTFQQQSINYDNRSASFVAVRPPHELAFDHVFTLVTDYQDITWRIDPTAPSNADYTNWEPMTLKLF